MKYLIYKITNTLNGRYYIGRHATNNINDGYLGSGKAISNAIKKYGKDAFVKEIVAESFSKEDLWELEKIIVNIDVVKDPLSYNMAYGGKSYLDGLKKYDKEKFFKHQSDAGKKGGPASYSRKSDIEKKKWHSNGGISAANKHKNNKNHPFFNGVAASLGGKAIKGMVDLWHPDAISINAAHKNYKKGDRVRMLPGSIRYYTLLSMGWLTIQDQMKKVQSMSIPAGLGT